jgi:glycosyltransferase involved in cell wall biosynthesis
MKISIITPNYNYSKYIHYTIESVIKQDYQDYEHIIVDDGSTDNSLMIIENFITKYPNKIRLIKQSNKGQTFALNNALENVTGDIICWINSDDLFNDTIFSQVVSVFNKYPKLDALFGDIYVINEIGKKIKIIKYLPFNYVSGVFIGFGKIIPSNGIFWRSSIARDIGPFNTDLNFAMDSEYWSRLLFRKNVMHIKLNIAMFRWHSGAKTIQRRNKFHTSWKEANNEDNYVSINAYKKLTISKYIPYKYAQILKLFYKTTRILLKTINGHYIARP